LNATPLILYDRICSYLVGLVVENTIEDTFTAGSNLDEDGPKAIPLARPLQIPTLANRGRWKTNLNKFL